MTMKTLLMQSGYTSETEIVLQYCINELIAVVCEFIEIAEQLIDTLVYEFFNRIPLRYRQMLEYSWCET